MAKNFQVTVEFQAQVEQLKTKINEVTGKIKEMGNSAAGNTQIQQQFNNLTAAVDNLQSKMSQPITSQGDFNRLAQELQKAKTGYDNLLSSIERMHSASVGKKIELLPPDQQEKIKKAQSALKTYENALSSSAGKAKELRSEQERLAQQKAIAATARQDIKQYEQALEQARTELEGLRKDQEKFEAQKDSGQKEASSLRGKIRSASNKEGNEAEVAQLNAQLEQTKQKISEAKNRLSELGPQIDTAASKEEKFNSALEKARLTARTASEQVKIIKANVDNLDTNNPERLKSVFEKLKQEAQQLGIETKDLGTDTSSVDSLQSSLETLKGRFEELVTSGVQQADAKIEEFATTVRSKVGPAIQNSTSALQQMEQAYKKFSSRLDEVNQFKSQIQYFFSLTNSVYLLRAALQSAIETIKELDAVMTEAAVVTDFSVGDMWDKLPQYTKEASALGASVKDLYSATTLYYQQGLKGTAAMEVGIETMKMARIAGMEAGDATQYMTAALRGFNMEVNELNATRVNDVYSELAAITASDTAQIATAMSKTASIAASANMEFETTAALLAQIIETTQEAPETAGTALKTIIARFSEVKSLREKGQKTGKDEEGEEIDVNKIDKALKSVGISMEGFFAGAEGLDSILLKLAEKWGTLDFETQRYIATMAAGSRQQSRFIAMMSDYSRTTELVEAANMSAGASTQQFEKTLDSLESKLNQLQNAWSQFTMGIADNEVVKEAIDILTVLLQMINDLIAGISGKWLGDLLDDADLANNKFAKLTKSVLSLVAAFGAIRLGKGLLDKGFDKITEKMERSKEEAQEKIKKEKGITSSSGEHSVSAELQKGGEAVRQNLTTGSKEAGEILVSAAKQAAAIEKKGEEAGVAVENAGENAGVAIENTGEQVGVTIENEGALAENGIEATGKTKLLAVEGAFDEAQRQAEAVATAEEIATRQIGAEAAASTEIAGSTIESSNEVVSSQIASKTEIGSATKSGIIIENASDAAGIQQLSDAAQAGQVALAAAGKEAQVEINTALIKRQIETGGDMFDAPQIDSVSVEGNLPATREAKPATTGSASFVQIGQGASVPALPGKTGGKGLFKGLGGKIGDFFGKYKGWIAGIGSIVAGIGVIGTVTDAILEKTDENITTSQEKAEHLAGLIEVYKDGAETANSNLSQLGETRENFTKIIASLKTLKKGSAEWASSVHEVRTQMLDILDVYPKLRDYTEQQNGITILTDQGWEEYEKMLLESYYNSSSGLYAARMAQLSNEQIAMAENLNLATSSISQEEQDGITKGEKYGAYAGGAALGIGLFAAGTAIASGVSGAVAGAVAGSVVPIIGTVIGAALGVIVGAALGEGIMGIGTTAGVDPETINQTASNASAFRMQNGEYFSAQEATDQDIKDLLALQGIDDKDEEYEEIYNYIKDNAEEFDNHTLALKENEAALQEFGHTLGQIQAEREGLTGDEGDIFADIYSLTTKDLYQSYYDQEYAKIKKEDLEDKENIKIITEVTGYTYDENSHVYKDSDGNIVYDPGNSENQSFSIDEQKGVLANSRAITRLTGEVKETFTGFVNNYGTDAGKIATAAMSDDYGTLTHEQTDKLFGENGVIAQQTGKLEKALDWGYSTGNVPSRVNGVEDLMWFLEHNDRDTGAKMAMDYTLRETTTHMGAGRGTDTQEISKDTAEDYLRDRNSDGKHGYLDSRMRGWIDQEHDESFYNASLTGHELIYDEATVLSVATKLVDGVTTSEIEDYVTNGNLKGAYNVNEIEEMRTTVAGYAEDLAFLYKVPMETAIKFGNEVNGMLNLYDLGEYEDKFKTILNNIFSGLEVEQYALVANYLADLDFRNLTELETFEMFLEDVPGVTEQAKNEFSEFVEYLADAGLALADIDLESLIEQLNGAQKVIKKINDLKVGEDLVFSKEEFANVLSSGGNREDFVATLDGYVYLGDSMESLRETIQKSNAILLELQNDALGQKVKTGNFIGRNEKLSSMSWGTTDTWTGDQINNAFDYMLDQAIEDYNKEGKKEAESKGEDWTDITLEDVNEDNWGQIVGGTSLQGYGFDFAQKWMGETTTDENGNITGGYLDWYEGIDEGEREIIRKWLQETGDAFMNVATYEQQYSEGLRDIEEQELSLKTGQEIVSTQSVRTFATDKMHNGKTFSFTDETGEIREGQIVNGQVVDAAGAVYDDVVWDENTNGWVQNSRTYSNQAAQNALDYQLSQYDGGVVTAERWGQEITSNKDQTVGLSIGTDGAQKTVKDFEMMESTANSLTKALVVDFKKAEKAQDNLNTAVSDNKDAFKNAEKGSQKYNKALDKITQAAKAVFGNDITTEFVEKNKDLFLQLAEGGETAQAAYEELGMRAAAEFLGMERKSAEFANVINAAMSGIPTDLEIGATFDATQAINNLMALGYTAKEAAMLLEKMGYTVTYTTETHYIGDTTGTDYGTTNPSSTTDNESVTTTDVVVASGVKNDAAGSGGGGGGGGGGGSNNYENGYDRLHNALQEINDVLRERERLERQYQRLLDRNLATAKQLSKISRQNIAAYQFEISKQKDIIAGRIAQIEGEKLSNPDLQNLIYTEQGRDGNQSIRINWERLQAIKNADAGERADEYYDRIQGWLESIYEAQTAIEEAQDAIYEEMLQGKDEYLELEEQVKEAIINERQKEIDKLSAINDSINDTNSKLLESMQQQLDEYRQNRDNAKTEDEITDKQRRLAYLQQDTSGANAKEILDLQKEIDESQESYTDQLIDQKISELQQQNDKAAEQRQQQIDIMQAQLDKYSESSEIWEDVAELVAEGTSAAEGLVSGSELETLLKSSEAFAGMSKIQKMDWLNQINNQLAAALKWLSDGATSSMNNGKTVTFATGDRDTKGKPVSITGTVNSQGQVVTEDGAVFNKVEMDAYGNYSTSETMAQARENQEAEKENKINQEEIAMFPYGKPTQISAQPTYGESSGLIKALQHALNVVGNYNLTVDGVWGYKTSNAIYTFKNKNGLNAWNTPWSDIMKALESKVKEKLKGKMQFTQYKTGGLADFTGPAWLDGTKSRPEYILNADQTKAFFNLIDVLGSLQTSNSKTAQNSGDNTYDIDINVESIGSDYDVEQLATTVKRLINEDARYRNNNAINLMR